MKNSTSNTISVVSYAFLSSGCLFEFFRLQKLESTDPAMLWACLIIAFVSAHAAIHMHVRQSA